MAEKKYIELQKALNVCEMHYQHCLEMHDWSGDTTADNIKRDIETLPTADVAEVVRCKDCVYCDRCYPVKEINKEATEGWYCNPNRHYVKPDDFCSYGERRDT